MARKTSQIYLHFNLTHFLNFPEQLASRLEDHRTTGNVICHLIAGPLLGVASLSLVNLIAGYNVAVACTGLLAAWCLANDLMYGFVYTLFSMTTCTYQLSYDYGPPTILYSLLTILLGISIQLGIGHMYFERRPPNELEGIVKGDGRLFALLDLVCEIVPGTFHFYTILLLKLGFRPKLNMQVQRELKRIDTITANH